MTPTVAQAILELLARHGTRRAFGIPGVHNLAYWDSDLPEPFRIIGVRHEQAATYAADGLYRATGEIAAALLTSGPGVANAVAGFGEAFTSGSPVVVLGSEVGMTIRSPEGVRGILHEMHDQAGLFAAFGAPARSARTKQEAMAYAVMALREAMGQPPTSGYVGVPTDVLTEEWSAAIPHIPSIPATPVDPHEIGRIAELLAMNPRVVLWLGSGVVSAGAEEMARQLATVTGAVVLTSYSGRGLLAAYPGLVNAPVHEPEVSALLAEADLLVVLGSSFDGMNTKNWKLDLPAHRAAITLGSTIDRTVPFDALVHANLADALPLLIESCAEVGLTARPLWTDVSGIRTRLLDRLAADPRTSSAVELVNQVDSGWPDEGAVICDMAVAGYWVGGYSDQPRPRRLQYPVGWGTLGYALPAAIGPASVGIPTLAVCGDGGPMFALGELATYAQESLPITLLIVDDGGYGMLRFDQQVFGHPERGVDLVTPDWATLGQAFGIASEEIAQAGELGIALGRAHAANLAGQPRIIVWKHRLHPPRTTSPRWHE